MQTLSISIVFLKRNHALIICTRFLNYGLLCSTNKYGLTRKRSNHLLSMEYCVLHSLKTFNLHNQSLFNHIVYKMTCSRVLEDDLQVILYHLIYETMSLEMFDVVNEM